MPRKGCGMKLNLRGDYVFRTVTKGRTHDKG